MSGHAFTASQPHQATFADALFDPARPCPPGLRTRPGVDPARRLAVYRNNVVSSLIDALADTFPVTQRLVGEDFFRSMAGVYVRQDPPRSPVLAHYGVRFAAFVGAFEPAATLPYLADVARLEFARLEAYHAADADALPASAWADALSRPDDLPGLDIEWHPSVRVLESDYAVVTLWSTHQLHDEIPCLEVDHAECAVVLRDAWDVLVLPAGRGAAAFIRACLTGATLGAAADQALLADPGFDLASTFSLLLAHRAVCGLHCSSSPHP